MQPDNTHPFERAGLGKAPFRYVGMQAQEISYGQAVIGRAGGVPITTAPGGSCAYCGNYIVNMFNVKSSDGRIFHVGSDCVEKVAASAPQAMLTIVAAVKRDLGKKTRERNKERMAERAEEARIFFDDPEVEAWMAGQPHPHPALAHKGKTLADYHAFCNFGDAGLVKQAKIVKAAMAKEASEKSAPDVKLSAVPTSETQEQSK